ncbi:hypothetical protein ColTof4_01146 [Colletotrichum tofieldiae]|nr:hypothetical protein ColTof4_01146 [Colletotrichum tofieldiae]GKT96741.1 hypothetical protein Ct61P_14591 [Colletotrichum tofieldiae]
MPSPRHLGGNSRRPVVATPQQQATRWSPVLLRPPPSSPGSNGLAPPSSVLARVASVAASPPVVVVVDNDGGGGSSDLLDLVDLSVPPTTHVPAFSSPAAPPTTVVSADSQDVFASTSYCPSPRTPYSAAFPPPPPITVLTMTTGSSHRGYYSAGDVETAVHANTVSAITDAQRCKRFRQSLETSLLAWRMAIEADHEAHAAMFGLE